MYASKRHKPKPFKFKDKIECNLFVVVFNCILNSRFSHLPAVVDVHGPIVELLLRRCFKYRHVSACIYLLRMDSQCRKMLPACIITRLFGIRRFYMRNTENILCYCLNFISFWSYADNYNHILITICEASVFFFFREEAIIFFVVWTIRFLLASF